METLTEVRNGFYGTEEETAVVIDGNCFIIQSPDFWEGLDWTKVGVESLIGFEFLGERLSEDFMLEFHDILDTIYAELCVQEL